MRPVCPVLAQPTRPGIDLSRPALALRWHRAIWTGDLLTSGTEAVLPAAETDRRQAGDRRFLLGALGVALLLRFEGLLWPLKPDESGFLLVSRSWHPQPESLYGFFFVDRPPVLIGLFRLADVIGGQYAPRVPAALLVLLLVYAAYRTGLLLGGTGVARWTAVAAVALTGQPDLELWAAKSESLGVPLVTVSCWLSLEALHATPGRRRNLYALAAGVTGALALGMKQNLIGGAVFGLVLLGVALRTRRLTIAEARVVAGSAIAGFALPLVGVVVWALAAGVALPTLWDTLFGFRGQALSVIRQGHLDAPGARLEQLVVLSVITGAAVALLWFLAGFRSALRSHPEAALAALVMGSLDLLGLALGGSYWEPYLTALFPGVILAVAIASSTGTAWVRRGARMIVAASAASLVVYGAGWTVGHLDGSTTPRAEYVGAAVKQSAEPGDTIVVLYGRADIVLASGLSSPYEHLWSLPARTLDPELEGLRTLLTGDAAPTWVVAWLTPNSWDIDHDGKLRAVLEANYAEVGEVCDAPVLLRRGLDRAALPQVDCHRPWF